MTRVCSPGGAGLQHLTQEVNLSLTLTLPLTLTLTPDPDRNPDPIPNPNFELTLTLTQTLTLTLRHLCGTLRSSPKKTCHLDQSTSLLPASAPRILSNDPPAQGQGSG